MPKAPDAAVPETPAELTLSVANPKLPILAGSTGSLLALS
jgi:hypothetical protein